VEICGCREDIKRYKIESEDIKRYKREMQHIKRYKEI
jgi:hypothetical protein